MHVSQAWDVITKGDSPLHDPVTQSPLNGAEAVRAELRSVLGTDLTVRTEMNPFWHTGHPVKLRGGTNEREYRPWDDVRKVAAGLRAGKQRGHAQAWKPYVQHVIDDLLFPK